MDAFQSHLQTYLATDFWRAHGVGFLLLAFLVPRIATIPLALSFPFSPVFVGGWWYWPRITLAILMSLLYWHSNPELCILAGVAALADDYEKKYFLKAIKALVDNWDEVAQVGLKLVALVIIGSLVTIGVLHLPWTKAIVIGVIAILLTGCALYFFRETRKRLYGIFEIILALFLGGYAIAQAGTDSRGTILGLVSFVLFVVDGLGNLGTISEIRTFFGRGGHNSPESGATQSLVGSEPRERGSQG